jgi:hypothetical protein
MPEIIKKGPPDEQGICVGCGFCCDGTLFLHAHLNPGERGSLPEKIEQQSYTKEGKDYFRLPCLYFNRKCTIYDLKRADVCLSYRCQLLKDFAEGRVTQDDAVATVREAMEMRGAIMKEYRRMTGAGGKINFRDLLAGMGKIQKSAGMENRLRRDFEMLLARCNIFEALLIKHFRSAEDFEKMIMK